MRKERSGAQEVNLIAHRLRILSLSRSKTIWTSSDADAVTVILDLARIQEGFGPSYLSFYRNKIMMAADCRFEVKREKYVLIPMFMVCNIPST